MMAECFMPVLGACKMAFTFIEAKLKKKLELYSYIVATKTIYSYGTLKQDGVINQTEI